MKLSRYFIFLVFVCSCFSVRATDWEFCSESYLAYGQSKEDCSEADQICQHQFYAVPEFFFTSRTVGPGVGAGYRFHRENHGFDLSIHGFPVQVCSSRGFLPFLKGAFLLYPSSQGLYLGFGADLGIITGPLMAIGYESSQTNGLLLFCQLDGCYAITANRGIASLALGIGF